MKQLKTDDVRQCLYDMDVRTVDNNVSDAEFLASDFLYDLHLDEQRMLMMFDNLQRSHGIFLPPELTLALAVDNTVKTFLEAANALLQNLDE